MWNSCSAGKSRSAFTFATQQAQSALCRWVGGGNNGRTRQRRWYRRPRRLHRQGQPIDSDTAVGCGTGSAVGDNDNGASAASRAPAGTQAGYPAHGEMKVGQAHEEVNLRCILLTLAASYCVLYTVYRLHRNTTSGGNLHHTVAERHEFSLRVRQPQKQVSVGERGNTMARVRFCYCVRGHCGVLSPIFYFTLTTR